MPTEAKARAFLPYGRQSIDADDVAAVAEVLRSDWLTTGPAVDAFEAAFSGRLDGAHCIACSSGTAALHLAAAACGLGEGDRVIVPAMTFAATANAARFVGAEVTFADVDPDSGLMRPADLEAALAAGGPGQARAVFPVHLAGQAADMDAIRAIAEANGLKVVEDACHAVGTTTQTADGTQEPVGAARRADAACFSFHPVKTIAAGEGGMVTTRDPATAERARLLRNHGIVRDAEAADPWTYDIEALGWNYRASDIHCALGLSQLAKLDRFIARRRALAARYDVALDALAPAVRPAARVASCDPAWHLYVVLVDFAALGVTRAALMRALAADGIGTQVHYIPVHRLGYYATRYGAIALPGADAYYARALSLPLFPAMADGDVDRVVAALARHLGLAA